MIGNNPLMAVEMNDLLQLQFILKLTFDQKKLEEALFLAVKELKINFFNPLFSKLKIFQLEDKIIDVDLKLLMSVNSNPLKIFQMILTKKLRKKLALN